MKRLIPPAACALVLAMTLLPAAESASSPSSTLNWSTQGEAVVCGVAEGIQGTAPDPGAGAPMNGLWRGLQCQATGLPHAPGIGDPAVQLGQGRAGRARLVDISQDDLVSDTEYLALAPGSLWNGYGIACTVNATSVRCTNDAGYGFTLSPGQLHLFAPAGATSCGSVSYTFPHTNGEGRAALNRLMAVGVSCATARSLASAFLATGKPSRYWHAVTKLNSGEEVFTRGKARVTGYLAN